MRIAVDAMGGDLAPAAPVEGAVRAARAHGVEVVLVGDEAQVRPQLDAHDVRGLAVSLWHASEVVGMEDAPALSLRRKRDSSIRVCFDLVKTGEAAAVVSAGNSGAVMATGVWVVKTVEGIERPALALLVPTLGRGTTVLLDVGVNVGCKPHHVAQFAVMGSVYAQHVLGAMRPRVGLLSNGTEETKGTDLIREAHDLLKRSTLNYVGCGEGRDIYNGRVDVMACEGFVGNVALKSSEGIVAVMLETLVDEVRGGLARRLGYLLVAPAFRAVRRKFDDAEYGGAPLLGIAGVAVVCHGASPPRAIENAVRMARDFVATRVNDHLAEALCRNPDLASFTAGRVAKGVS